jgi:hypothetical protein
VKIQVQIAGTIGLPGLPVASPPREVRAMRENAVDAARPSSLQASPPSLSSPPRDVRAMLSRCGRMGLAAAGRWPPRPVTDRAAHQGPQAARPGGADSKASKPALQEGWRLPRRRGRLLESPAEAARCRMISSGGRPARANP